MRPWPRPLDEVLARPSVQVCPVSCPYSVMCSEGVQRGIERLLIDGFLIDHTQCTWFDKHREPAMRYFGKIPESSTELLELIAWRIERDGIEGEAS